ATRLFLYGNFKMYGGSFSSAVHSDLLKTRSRLFGHDLSVSPEINGRAIHAGGFAGDQRRASKSTASGRERGFGWMLAAFRLHRLISMN
ncbi:MAG: hypothetical protein ACRED1_08445, partial [Limisphaerales bacterium]